MTVTMPTNIMVASGLVKRYGAKVALDGVDISVKAGETLALIGPSGSGKSTLCRTMVGLEPFVSGTIYLERTLFVQGSKKKDRVSFGPESRRCRLAVGMVFQEFSLFPQLSVSNNVMIGPRKVLGRSAKEARQISERVLAMVGLEEFSESFPEKLSGGQKQRVAIARELAMERRIIFLDEVTSALDPELVHEVLQVVRQLTGSGMTIVMVTHEISFARNVADRVIFMDNGRIVEEGTPTEIFDSAREQRTRTFLERVL